MKTFACPSCKQRFAPEGRPAGGECACPSCGHMIRVAPSAAVTRARRPAGWWQRLIAWLSQDRMHPIVSWTLALALHVIILAALAALGVFGGGRPGKGDGLRAGIVLASQQGTLKGARDAKPVIAPSSLELSAVTMPEPAAIEPFLPRPETQPEPIKILGVGETSGAIHGAGDWGDLAIGSSGGRSGKGGTSFFGIRAEGGSFVYIVDKSGSMQDRPLLEAKAQLMSSIAELSGEHRFYVFFYDNRSHPMPARNLLYASHKNKAVCGRWVAGIAAGGGTNPTDALLAAIRMKPDVIFLMSDGLFDDKVCIIIRQAQGRNPVTVHTIGFINRAGERVLQRIAEENRGIYRFVPGGAGMP